MIIEAAQRSDALLALGDLILKNTARFAELEALSMGTPTVFYHMQTEIANKLLNCKTFHHLNTMSRFEISLKYTISTPKS